MSFRIGRTVPGPGWGHESDCCGVLAFLMVVAVAVAVPWIILSQQMQMQADKAVLEQIDLNGVVTLSHNHTPQQREPFVGKPVLLLPDPSGATLRANKRLGDSAFGVEAPDSTLRLKRKVYYCQWAEHSVTHTEGSGDNKRTYTTYFYTKGWYPFPLVSIFYDQPFAHHNPLREPYRAERWEAESVKVGDYTVHASALTDLTRWKPLHVPSEAFDQTSGPATSQAARDHGFYYIGEGRFYSAYQESDAVRYARIFGEFLEGSLLDWQLGDLFSQCTPGDIRVEFMHVAPESISVLGALEHAHTGNIVPIKGANGASVIIAREGTHTASALIAAELGDIRWWTVVHYIMGIVWAICLSCAILYDTYAHDYERLLVAVNCAVLLKNLLDVLTASYHQYTTVAIAASLCGFICIVYNAHTSKDERRREFESSNRASTHHRETM